MYGGEMLRINGPRMQVIIRSIAPSGDAPGKNFTEENALIDTGASIVCIDRFMAKRLGLELVNVTKMDVVGNRIDACVYAGWLEVPELGFSKMMMLFAPDNAMPTSQVLLGRSFLSNFIMNYDGPSDTFQFFRPGMGLAPPVEDE